MLNESEILFRWRGGEESIGLYSVVVSELTIAGLVKDKSAFGTITIKDYIEGGIEGNDPWIAEAIVNEGITRWFVKRASDEDCFIDREGEPLFTLIPEINAAIKEFVAKKIEFHLSTGIRSVEVPKYAGDLCRYEGSCQCLVLLANPSLFDRNKMNNKYAERCFECSCGEKWWEINPDERVWAKVKDPAAWQMLLEHNGVPTQLIGAIEGGVFLMQTIRNKGIIPMF